MSAGAFTRRPRCGRSPAGREMTGCPELHPVGPFLFVAREATPFQRQGGTRPSFGILSVSCYYVSVKQVIVLKLEPSPEQHAALLETLAAFNAGCQYAADVAYEKRCANKVALQPTVYGPLREQFGLSAQMAIPP